MNETMNETKATPMEKLATFIVDKRNLFFLLYIFALVFCIFSTNWVNVENDITKYLPDSTETRRGLTVMDEQFVTYGTAKVMISNISYEHALELQEVLNALLTKHLDATKMFRCSSRHLHIVCDDEVQWTLDGEDGGSWDEVDLFNHQQVLPIICGDEALEDISSQMVGEPE